MSEIEKYKENNSNKYNIYNSNTNNIKNRLNLNNRTTGNSINPINPGNTGTSADVPKKSYIQMVLEEHGSPEKAVEAVREESRIHPVNARLNLQVLLNTLGREEESFAVSNELMKIAPEDPRVLFNHGWHWLKRGELQKGLAYLEYGRPLQTYGHQPPPSKRPKWVVERSNGKGYGQHVLMLLEGGLGDEIIHVRFVRELVERYDCRVIVVAQPSLASVFARMPQVSAVAQREAALGIYHDSWIQGMSAALELGLESSDLRGEPYLTPSPRFQQKWREALKSWAPASASASAPLRIGIRWAGNPQFEHQQYRLFPPQILIDLADDAELKNKTQFFSFQRDNNLQSLPPSVGDLEPLLNSWEDTAAALCEMDLVITSCTSVAHMSAALGRPTWVLVPALPYFIWAHPGETSPWYDSVRLFRQSVFGEWDRVGADIRTALREYTKTKRCQAVDLVTAR